jgi:hypothetical protein
MVVDCTGVGVGKLCGAVVRKERMDGERGGWMAANVLDVFLSARVEEELSDSLLVDDIGLSTMSKLVASLALLLVRFRLLLFFFDFDIGAVQSASDDVLFMSSSSRPRPAESSNDLFPLFLRCFNL